MTNDFEKYLKEKKLSENTIVSYVHTMRQFEKLYGKVNQKNLMVYKAYLLEHFKFNTVNLRIRAVNCYLESTGKTKWRLSFVKIQQKAYLENVISEADYKYFKTCLKGDGEMKWYFVIRYMASTGVRVSELIQFKIEHVERGYIDIYSKGGKVRRVYIPTQLQVETMKWLEEEGRNTGFLFLNRYGNQITPRGIANQLKKFAGRYHINLHVVYPHSFRHRFAKSFLERYGEIALLADLMGHENIETTRIYLRKTSTEQREIVDRIVDW